MEEPSRNGIESSVEVELRGLSIYTHHGVSDSEQEVGQRLEFDVSFDVPDCDAVLTDRIEDTVDYAEVCDIVALAATERSYRTLERLAQVVGERLIERYGCDSVRVRAAKPEPPLPLALEEVAVEVVPDDEVVLEYGQRIICLAGRAGAVLVPVLLPLLDGTHTLAEIVEVLGEPARLTAERHDHAPAVGGPDRLAEAFEPRQPARPQVDDPNPHAAPGAAGFALLDAAEGQAAAVGREPRPAHVSRGQAEARGRAGARDPHELARRQGSAGDPGE